MSFLSIKEELLKHFSRAPSVHNTQPFCFEFFEDRIIIYDNPKRILQVGDPDERDHELSLGVMIEGCDIVLKNYGFHIENFSFLCDEMKPLRRRAILTILPFDRSNDMFELFILRKSYRGLFPKLSTLERNNLIIELNKLRNLKILGLGKELTNWANRYDQASYSFTQKNSYLVELYSWMRFTRRHPDYAKDGLNAEALSLNKVEAWFAKFLLKPLIFTILKSVRLGRALISEAPQIRSSLAVIAVTAPRDANRFEQGRIFLQTWLELTKLGLSATPLSALADEAKSYQSISSQLEPDVCLVNVMRVGKIPIDQVYKSPRLSVEQIELK